MQVEEGHDVISCFFCEKEIEDKGKIYCYACVSSKSNFIKMIIKLAEKVNDMEAQIEELNSDAVELYSQIESRCP